MSREQHGFTLIEILVALAVFAVLAAAGIALMRTSLDSRSAVAESTERIGELQRARALLRRDFAQLRLRASRDRDGLRRDWRFLGNSRPTAGEPLIAFLRGGWTNPGMRAPRSELAYVEYRLEDGKLMRRLRLRPDPTRETPAAEAVLLDAVERARVSYFVRGAWRSDWRVPADEPGPGPAAVALELELAEIGRVRQVFLTQEAPS